MVETATLAGVGASGSVAIMARESRLKSTKGHRTLTILDDLRMPRVWLHGPKWKRSFGVREVPIEDLVPADQVSWHRPGKKLLIWSFEEDIREMLLDEIRPGVYAEWNDPLERFRRLISPADATSRPRPGRRRRRA